MSAREKLLKAMVEGHLYMVDDEANRLLDAYKAEVLREAIDMILDPSTWTKYGYTKGTQAQYLILARKVARMLDPGRVT